jgi:hypothetical protein
MGATRVPVITNPGNDPGRNQPRKDETDATDARSGRYRDQESQMHNPGGAATCRKTWFGDGYEPGGQGHEATEARQANGPAPRDRGHRTV